MGHKVNPECLRLSLSRDWRSRWFAPTKKLFVQYLQQDRAIRELLEKELASAAVARVVIERSVERVRIVIHTARPGILIGRRGENIQRLQERIQRIIGTQHQLKMDYVEVSNPAVEAKLVADSLAFQLEKRIAFRRAMKRAIQQAMESGAAGIKVVCDGRLAGAEMTRREVYRAGKVPLGTLRARIEFGTSTAHTTAGCIGTKVWVCRGELATQQPARARAGSTGADAATPVGGEARSVT
ncbi:MAG: 30S ribosomal protein S3 [Candidatus Omnitrophica bacterium]|nr:30S ribosomal protein S3 [Candidatus Omnitrophota bacterium]